MTAISTDTLTITRTQESSSARTVVTGDQIAATITVKTLTDIETSDALKAPLASPSFTGTVNIGNLNLVSVTGGGQITGTNGGSFNVTDIVYANNVNISAPSSVSGMVATVDGTQTITNKTIGNTNAATLKGTSFTLQDATDTTKQAIFDMSSITTATTRTYTLPNTTGTLITTASTSTLTNKRITPRINSIASSATPAINTDTTDQFNITAQAVAITSMTTSLTGTPTDGQKLLIRIKDNGTAQTITWGTSFASSGTATLLSTTVSGKTHMVGLIYDSTAAKWICQAVDSVGY